VRSNSRTRKPKLLLTLGAAVAITAFAAVQALSASAPPAPVIDSGPSDPTSLTTATFTFHDSQSGVTFQCKLDGAAYAACASPKSYSGLAKATHTFSVKAVNSTGGTSGETKFTWTISKPPPPAITGAPADGTTATTATFGFTDGQPGVTFQCRLDGAAYAACSSPKSYPGPIAAGGHDFRVRALDSASVASDETKYHWEVAKPPKPDLSGRPDDNTFHTTATFVFADADTDPGVTFQCRLDGSAWTACASPKTYAGPLGAGGHDFDVRLLNAAGDPSDNAHDHWSIVQPPKPAITSGPSDPTGQTSATFTFTDSDTDPGVGFQCKLDGAQFAACSSPKTYPGPLSLGNHSFKVRLLNAAGDASDQASYGWKIVASSAQPFTITGSATGLLYPGGTATPINLTFANPNSSPITVSGPTVTVAITSTSSGSCPVSGNFVVTQYSGPDVAVPASGSRALSGAGVPQSQWPKIAMNETGANQDACKLATLNLSYSGTANG
jgi:hypothetical protein